MALPVEYLASPGADVNGRQASHGNGVLAEPKPFFPGIHALRAVAATLVVIQHAAYVANDYFVFGYDIDNDYFIYGRVGVILFFAISGFVIALQRTKPVGVFIVHRLLRIYPNYWLATLFAAAALVAAKIPLLRVFHPSCFILRRATTAPRGYLTGRWPMR
jgi:peptidoglycan/LPS O-acetylase OafA/YrhL